MANKTLTLAEIEQLREKPGPDRIPLPEARIRQLMEYGYGSQIIKRVLERELGVKVSRVTVARRMKELREENP